MVNCCLAAIFFFFFKTKTHIAAQLFPVWWSSSFRLLQSLWLVANHRWDCDLCWGLCLYSGKEMKSCLLTNRYLRPWLSCGFNPGTCRFLFFSLGFLSHELIWRIYNPPLRLKVMSHLKSGSWRVFRFFQHEFKAPFIRGRLRVKMIYFSGSAFCLDGDSIFGA